MSEPKHIKLNVPGESFWAKQLSENTAEVDNILLEPSIGLGDIVKFNPKNNSVETVLVKKTNTMAVNYPTDGDIKETYKTLYNHLEGNDIQVEGMMAGMALIAVPVGMLDSTIEDIVSKCPVKLDLIKPEEEKEED
jgi:hypothetical protein